MQRYFYSDSIHNFLKTPSSEILGVLSQKNEFELTQTQRDAWVEQIAILQETLVEQQGSIYFEYSIPRMGKRIDVILIIKSLIFVLEFKVGESQFSKAAIDQVYDYALDLKNFQSASHNKNIVPIVIATNARDPSFSSLGSPRHDKLFSPILTNKLNLKTVIEKLLKITVSEPVIIGAEWEQGSYSPTPTIIEAAIALYNNHSVSEITRNDASAVNLGTTSKAISKIINESRNHSHKTICFLTGVPGAGKTLVGLDIATKHLEPNDDLYSVYLSGNGPLVKILCEALARDKVQRAKDNNRTIRLGQARSDVKAFIQNVHHFRDDCLSDTLKPPIEHVAIFDEAQRAWNLEQTSTFMHRKKNTPGFNLSEPEFLISCLDRHKDWAVIVCLVGGGQEINTGEAGISEWMQSIVRSYPDWHIYISSKLVDSEYNAEKVLRDLNYRSNVTYLDQLHLSVSMRSFRAENVSKWVKQVLDLEVESASETFLQIKDKYPIVLTRDLSKAKLWLKQQARGTERYGMVVSSQAERLKPLAINVKSPMDPVHWFLDDKDDVRSSYYLEDVATEFQVQGLELDWVCVTWDADFRHTPNGWGTYSFSGNRWVNIKKSERQQYLKNAYRVLLTRARQGMVIVVPNGDDNDLTRQHKFYDPIYQYLTQVGLREI